MKYILSTVIGLSLVLGISTTVVHAAATIPPTVVWVTPQDAAPADPIVLNAFVFNNSSAQASVIVTFSANGTIIATSQATLIPATSAKVVTADWLMPTTKTTLVAAVSHATDTSTKKELSPLEGAIGTTTIGGVPDVSLPHIPAGFAGSIINVFETFRIKELNYFTALKIRAQTELGNTTISEVGTLLHVQTQSSGASTHILPYLTLAYASVGKALFAQKAIYYTLLILIVLLVIRFIFSRLL